MDISNNIELGAAIYALFLLLIGYFIAKFSSQTLAKTIEKRFSKHQAMLVRRTTFYVLIILFSITALQQLGFNLTVLLGAAGVFTVAVSFASQTAMSNLISGVFLLFEHPFKVGDTIQTKNLVGKVDSIDLLSTKIVTFDNRLVRLPNESLIKSEICNLSYFPTRRADVLIGVSYDSDLSAVQRLLLDMAAQQPIALKSPQPTATVTQLADSAISIRLSVWTKTDNLSQLKHELQVSIQRTFAKENIEIPFPQITIHQA